ncbi:MAG TPA: hypothetical protein VJS39_05970, partial [Gemmatimonadaceae bacterium]|nr:hypothetical protein [Gemmatimonadaceae bacterium]
MTRTLEKTRLRYSGKLSALSPDARASLLQRAGSTSELVRIQTGNIVRRVRLEGDAALREMAATFDGVALEYIEVPGAIRRRALAELDPQLRSALE